MAHLKECELRTLLGTQRSRMDFCSHNMASKVVQSICSNVLNPFTPVSLTLELVGFQASRSLGDDHVFYFAIIPRSFVASTL